VSAITNNKLKQEEFLAQVNIGDSVMCARYLTPVLTPTAPATPELPSNGYHIAVSPPTIPPTRPIQKQWRFARLSQARKPTCHAIITDPAPPEWWNVPQPELPPTATTVPSTVPANHSDLVQDGSKTGLHPLDWSEGGVTADCRLVIGYDDGLIGVVMPSQVGSSTIEYYICM
jgi:hypothetical protein